MSLSQYRTCRHCQRKSVSRPRGLCWTCYYAPGVRDKYPPTSKYASGAVRADIDFNGPAKPAPEATAELPLTAGKVAVLQARAAACVNLWHPDDAERDVS